MSLNVTINDDISLEKIAKSGQCFRTIKLNNDTWRFISGMNVCYITQLSKNKFRVLCTEEKWQGFWFNYFDLGRNYEQIRCSIPASDVFLHNAANEAQGIRILKQKPFEMLLTFIISQRKAIPAIKNAVELLCKNWGSKIQTQYETIYSFPTPAQMQHVTENELKACKLGYRATYIKCAVDDVNKAKLNLDALCELDNKSLVEELKQVKGVGDKVANCISLFAYGRTGLAPVDTWIQKIMDAHYGGENHFLKYDGVAGIMQQYTFWWAQQHKCEFK